MNENLIEAVNQNLKEIINPISKLDIISDKTVKSVELKNDKILLKEELKKSRDKAIELAEEGLEFLISIKRGKVIAIPR